MSLSSSWDFNRYLGFTASISDNRLDYLNSDRRDDLLTIVGGVIFKIRPSLGIQVNYIHQNLYTNFPGAAFSRDFISVGAASKF